MLELQCIVIHNVVLVVSDTKSLTLLLHSACDTFLCSWFELRPLPLFVDDRQHIQFTGCDNTYHLKNTIVSLIAKIVFSHGITRNFLNYCILVCSSS